MFDRIKDGMYWDRAWKLVEGCTPVSEGCAHCWSARETHMRANNPNGKISTRNSKLTTAAGVFNGRIRHRDDNLDLPLRVKNPTAFSVWNDLFHEAVQTSFIQEAFYRMSGANRHQYFILTKHPERMRDVMLVLKERAKNSFSKWPLENVWLGTTIENNDRMYRIDHLLDPEMNWPNLYLSIEPMLSKVNIPEIALRNPHLKWVICGGESGPGARPMHPVWARWLRDLCSAAGVPFFFKQWGEWSPDNFVGYDSAVESGIEHVDPYVMVRVGKKTAGRILDGREYLDLPDIFTAKDAKGAKG